MLSLMNKEGDKMVALCFQDTNTICYIHFFQMKWSNKTKCLSGRFAEMKIRLKLWVNFFRTTKRKYPWNLTECDLRKKNRKEEGRLGCLFYVRGRSQTTLTRFCPLLTTYIPTSFCDEIFLLFWLKICILLTFYFQ